MGTKVGEMRESLMDAIEKVKAGSLGAQEATAIAKLAAQVSLSMQVEANIRLDGLKGEKLPLGEMGLGRDEATDVMARPVLPGASVFHTLDHGTKRVEAPL